MVRWAPLAALAVTLLLAWGNFLFTARWAALPGALNGWRQPWYAAALFATTVLAVTTRRQVGAPVRIGRGRVARIVLGAGAAVLVAALFSRLPLSTWTQIPFKDDYTPLYPVRGQWRPPAAARQRRRLELVAARRLSDLDRHRAEFRRRWRSSRW